MARLSLEYIRGLMRQEGIKYMYLNVSDVVSFLSECPRVGPNPNITGMRNLYWGKDALIVKQGRYAYKIS